MLALITILVVGLSTILTTERRISRTNLDNQRAKNFSEMGRDHAIAVLRDGIEAGRATGKFWASQPGRITVFNSDGTVDTTSSRDLSSGSDTTQPEVDINQATFSGNNPIASAVSVGTNVAPQMPVNWINVLSDPTTASGAGNPVVGRYAFWVDDESSKINVNTADGTSKYASPAYTAAASSAPVSYGNGLPTEISLQALTNSLTSANITATVAQNIASFTGVRPGAVSPRLFNSPGEVLQASSPATLYQDNSFSLTHYSRSPELNIFGEPKIYLMTVGSTSATSLTPYNLSIGPYWPFCQVVTGTFHNPTGLPLKQIYPSSNPCVVQNPGTFVQTVIPNNSGVGNQLPPFVVNSNISFGANVPSNSALPQYFAYDSYSPQGYSFLNSSYTYALGMRIAQYLKGYNSRGTAITWPTFPGSGSTGFAGKYTDRQIDSITVQILDLLTKDTLADIDSAGGIMPSCYSQPSFTGGGYEAKGFLSNLPVKGVGRLPHVNQVLMTFTVNPGNPPQISIVTDIQWYFPKEYKGCNLDINGMTYGYTTQPYQNLFNVQDYPSPFGYYSNGNLKVQTTGSGVTQPSPLGVGQVGSGFWANQMLKITGQDGNDAGVDLVGNDPDAPDPDQASAQEYHPLPAPSGGVYMGSGPITNACWPALQAGYNHLTPQIAWNVGDYRSNINNYSSGVFYSMRSVDPTNPKPPLPPLTSVTISGGIAVWTNPQIDPTPLDSIRGIWTAESLTDPAVKKAVLAAVIPLPTNPPFTIPVSSSEVTTRTVLMKVADPLVNSFPGDWISIADPKPSDISLSTPQPANEYPNGANAEFQAVGGGDPSAYWLPEMNQNIPKSQRFPSVGYLQYVRTGLMPDPANDPNDPRYVSGNTPHGTPFRLLSMAPSYDPDSPTQGNPGQTTAGGITYPDWAMLDLFTSPVSPQPLGSPTPPYLEMTYGGSTPGRVNPNSPLALFPFDSTVARSIPLEAVFKGLQVSNSYTEPPPSQMAETPVINTVDEKALASAVSKYVASLGRPFMIPGEVANVPEVANYTYNGKSNVPPLPFLASCQSRNDLVRQIVGSLTTQSNTFSVWTVGQAIKKRPGNTAYGQVENGDIVVGEARAHYIVERYIDLGTDGVPGNAKSGGAGADGIVGTADDVVDGDDTVTPNVPGANPKMTYPLPYKYRVIASEDVTN